MKLRLSILNQIEQFLSTDYLSIANVCFFLQSIRILIEIDKSKLQYKITSHYCNWILHKELDKSSSPEIINEINNSLNDFLTKSDSTSENDLIEKITNSLSVQKLIEELKQILWTSIEDKSLVSKIDYEQYWLNLVTIILNQIIYRPLKLNEKNVKIDKQYFNIYGIQLVHEKEKICIEILSKDLDSKDKRMVIDIAFFKK